MWYTDCHRLYVIIKKFCRKSGKKGKLLTALLVQDLHNSFTFLGLSNRKSDNLTELYSLCTACKVLAFITSERHYLHLRDWIRHPACTPGQY